MKSILSITSLIAAAALLLTGCGKPQTSAHHLKLGVIAGAEEQVAEVARQVARDKYNLDVELVAFNDYVTPNAALADGSLDANAFQHKPFLDQQIKDRGYPLVVVGRTFVYPIAAYSKRIHRLAELHDAATIAVPNDPTNLGRSLLLLERQGLIQLRPGAGVNATVLDITGNPRKFKIVELEAPQLPRSLTDVDLAIINTTYASQIGLTPPKDGIFVEDSNSPYVNLIVARENNQNSQSVTQFVQAYQSDEVYAAARKIFQDGVVKGW